MISKWTENAGPLKDELRRAILPRRGEMTAEDAAVTGQKAAQFLREWIGYRESELAMLYMPIRGEVDTAPLDAVLRACKWGVAYPRIASSEEMTMEARATGSQAELVESSYKILEPPEKTCPKVEPFQLALIIVPGVAFDRGGYRLGRGAGFYDRYLDQCTGATVIGLCYDWQLIEKVPREPHDVPMDGMLTHDGLHWANMP